MSDSEVAGSTPARVRRTLPIALVVVGLVAAAAGGLLVGRATAPGPDIVVAPEPVVEEAPLVDALPSGAASPVANAANPGLTVEGTMPASVPAVFSPDPELPDTPATASGYRVTDAGLIGADVAASLAAAFGVAGEAVAVDGGWLVGSDDGSGPSLRVADDPLVSWSFSDPAASAASDAAKPLGPDRAAELASNLLAGVGVEVDAVAWQVDRYDAGTTVTAWQLVDGSRSHLNWQVVFGNGAAVSGVSGFAASLEEVAGYPVVGAATAVRRSALPTWAVIGPTPVFETVAETEPAVVATATPVRPEPTPDRPALRVPLSGIVVTGAELGLAQYWQPDGDLLILPSYLLEGDDGSRWSLLAVAKEYVTFVDQPYPSVNPAAQ